MVLLLGSLIIWLIQTPKHANHIFFKADSLPFESVRSINFSFSWYNGLLKNVIDVGKKFSWILGIFGETGGLHTC